MRTGSLALLLTSLSLSLPSLLARDEPSSASPSTTSPAPQPAAAVAAPPAAPAVVMEAVDLGVGQLSLPASWAPKLRSTPPVTAVHVTPLPGLLCDLAILDGHGTAKQAEDYLHAGAKTYRGGTSRAPDLELGGHRFQGIRVLQPEALAEPDVAVVEMHAAISGDDLVAVGVTRLEHGEGIEAARTSCLDAFGRLLKTLPPAP